MIIVVLLGRVSPSRSRMLIIRTCTINHGHKLFTGHRLDLAAAGYVLVTGELFSGNRRLRGGLCSHVCQDQAWLCFSAQCSTAGCRGLWGGYGGAAGRVLRGLSPETRLCRTCEKPNTRRISEEVLLPCVYEQHELIDIGNNRLETGLGAVWVKLRSCGGTK